MQGTFPVSLDQSKTASLSEEVITFVKIRKEDNLFAFELSSVRRDVVKLCEDYLDCRTFLWPQKALLL